MRLGPTRFLTATNVFSSALGLLVSAYVARTLGPEKLGLMGVIAGINGSVIAFVDLRLNDVSAKAFFERDRVTDDILPAYRSGVLWLGVLGNATIAVFMTLAATAIGNPLIPMFTSQTPQWWWLPTAATTLAISATTGAFTASLRLANAFYLLGAVRVCSQAITAVATVLFLRRAPTLGNAYIGGLAGSLATLVLVLIAFRQAWTTLVPLGRPMIAPALAAYRANTGVLFHGNLLGYAKLLQRSADVLFVARTSPGRSTREIPACSFRLSQ